MDSLDPIDHAVGVATLQIVPMSPDMATALDEFHERLSPDTIRNRFFTAHPHLSADELARFTTVDHDDRDALVVLDEQRIVAVGRLDRLTPGSLTAEVAFVVDDAWQHRGVEAMLLRLLVERARQLGITRLEADTLATNTAMQAVFRHASLPLAKGPDHGVVHVTIEAAPPS